MGQAKRLGLFSSVSRCNQVVETLRKGGMYTETLPQPHTVVQKLCVLNKNFLGAPQQDEVGTPTCNQIVCQIVCSKYNKYVAIA